MLAHLMSMDYITALDFFVRLFADGWDLTPVGNMPVIF